MSLSRELRYQVIYTLKVRPEYKRLMYYFELEADGRTYCLYENKLCEKSEANDTSKQFFKYAWLNPSDIIAPPKWVGDTVWYQIMTRRMMKNSAYGATFRTLSGTTATAALSGESPRGSTTSRISVSAEYT